jgi:hypothetical protein
MRLFILVSHFWGTDHMDEAFYFSVPFLGYRSFGRGLFF